MSNYTEEIKTFLWAHHSKEKKHEFKLIYNWKAEESGNIVDFTKWEDRYQRAHKIIDYKSYSIKFLGDVINISLPVFITKQENPDSDIDRSELVSVKDEYLKFINIYIKAGMFSDRRWTIISKILNNFDVVVYNWVVCFVEIKKFDESEIVFKSKTESFKLEDTEFKLDVEDQNNIWDYEMVMLLVKEVQFWYYDVRTHSLVDIIEWQMIQQDYKIWRDIDITLKWEEIISLTQKDTEYSAVREKDWRFILTPDGNKVSSIWFKPYSIIEEDWITHIKLIWAYTHMLRNMLDFKPLSWQYNMLMWQKRITFVAWCRRSGKTLLWSYLIVRELWRMPDSIKQTQRTVKSFYVAPSEDKFKEVIDYIKTAAESIRMLKVIEFNKKENRLYLYDEKLWRWQKVKLTVSSCDFVSAKWYEPTRWKASDFILVDEAAFVPEDVWLNLLPILSNERAKFYAVSTIQRESMRNWFYEQLVDAEMWYDEESIWMRVTIDDLENTLIATEDKDRMKRSLKHNPQRYYAELYATFPNSQNVFNSEWFFNISREATKNEMVKWVIIWYDPAKRADTWAILVWEYREYSYNNSLQMSEYIELIEEYWLNWEYTQQKEFLQSLKQSFIVKWIPTLLVMDCTWVWEAVSEMMWNIVDFKVLYTANTPRPFVDSYWAWKVSKQLLVHWMQLLMEKNLIKAFSWLIKLMDEMKYFASYTTQAWNTRYEASAWHDDFVNAMMLIWFRYNYINWNIHKLGTWYEVRYEWVNPKTWLYEPYCARSDWSERKLKWNSYWFWC